MSDVDAAWLQHVTDLADAAGIELTPDDIPVLLNARVEAGWDAEGTEEAFAQFVGENYEDDDEDWYEDEDPDEDTDDMPEQDADVSPQLESDLAYNLARLQDRIGRPPTQHEITAAAEQVRDALARGGGPAEIAAAIEGSAKLTADMTSAEVRAFQVDRLRDGQPTVADRLEQDAANGREFSMDDHRDRVDFMVGRMHGVQFADEYSEPAGDESGFAGGDWE